MTVRRSERFRHTAGRTAEDATAENEAQSRLITRRGGRTLPLSAPDDESDEELQEDIIFYTCEMVEEAIDRVIEFQEMRVGQGYCINVAKNISGCSCLSELWDLGRREFTHVEFHTACEEMSLWFNEMENLETAKERELIDQSTVNNKLARCVFLKPRYGGRAHGTVVNMSTTDGLPYERFLAMKLTGWKGHDWDTSDKELQFPFHSALCLPSTLLVWRSLVGSKHWLNSSDEKVQQWLRRDYGSLVRDIRVEEIRQKKKKLRQRLFYTRVLDYMEANRDTVHVRYKQAFSILEENNWLGGKRRVILRKDWDKWRLPTIHILRSDSDMRYNQTTRELAEKMNIRISAISNKTVNFLAELFGDIRDSLNTRRKWYHVAKDRKLLYRPFANCYNIESAIDGYYTKHGGGGRLPGKIQARKNTPNNEYENDIGECDREIKESLLDMTEEKTKNLAFQPSLVISEVHKPQGAHIDYDTSLGYDQKYMIAFLPLTETGQFLQLWEKSVNGENSRGQVVFIPKGQMVLVPGSTIHGGGFRADVRSDNIHAHMRLHFYVYPGEQTSQIDRHKNEYMNESVYLQNKELLHEGMSLQTHFFDG